MPKLVPRITNSDGSLNVGHNASLHAGRADGQHFDLKAALSVRCSEVELNSRHAIASDEAICATTCRSVAIPI